jgi:hypothetical protein
MNIFRSGAIVQHIVTGQRYKIQRCDGGMARCTRAEDDINVEAVATHLLKLIGGPEQTDLESRLLVIEDRLSRAGVPQQSPAGL